MEIWRTYIPEYLLAICCYFIAKCLRVISPHPIAKHTLAILATSYCLNRNDRVSSFYRARGSKLCFLICFSYFSCYFHILLFLQKCYLLFSLRLFWLHRNLISHPISCTFGNPSWYFVHARPYFWHRTRGFLKARCSWILGGRITTGDPSPFRLLPKGSGANVCWTNANHTFLTHKNP
jgi:hypothetical protein